MCKFTYVSIFYIYANFPEVSNFLSCECKNTCKYICLQGKSFGYFYSNEQLTSDGFNVNMPLKLVKNKFWIYPGISHEFCCLQLPITGYKLIFWLFKSKNFSYWWKKPYFIHVIKCNGNWKSH